MSHRARSSAEKAKELYVCDGELFGYCADGTKNPPYFLQIHQIKSTKLIMRENLQIFEVFQVFKSPPGDSSYVVVVEEAVEEREQRLRRAEV